MIYLTRTEYESLLEQIRAEHVNNPACLYKAKKYIQWLEASLAKLPQ